MWEYFASFQLRVNPGCPLPGPDGYNRCQACRGGASAVQAEPKAVQRNVHSWMPSWSPGAGFPLSGHQPTGSQLPSGSLLLSHFSRVRLLATPWTAAYQAPPSMGFSRQEYWSGVPLPSPGSMVENELEGNNGCKELTQEIVQVRGDHRLD